MSSPSYVLSAVMTGHRPGHPRLSSNQLKVRQSEPSAAASFVGAAIKRSITVILSAATTSVLIHSLGANSSSFGENQKCEMILQLEIEDSMSVQIFLSAVSDEFQEYRDQLRKDLTRHNTAVKVEEDFKQGGKSTLENLDVYIRSCDAVVHLVGDMTGSRPKRPSIEYILTTYPHVRDKLPVLCSGAGIEGISYTQWEAWLAIYHDKALFVAEADRAAPRGANYAVTPQSHAEQRAHLEKLQTFERYRACKFKNLDDLAKHVAFGVILDLLAADLANTRPAALVEPLADMAAMAFVDLMRLVCVAGNDAARVVNEPRYPEFVDVADLHLAELKTHVTRIIAQISLEAIRRYETVERHMSYVLLRLRRGPKLDRSWNEFSKLLANLAEQTLGFIDFLCPGRYKADIEEAGSTVSPASRDPKHRFAATIQDDFVRRRFAAQSSVLRQIEAKVGIPILSIRDDIDRRLAIPYFAIDAALLRAL